MSLNHLEIEAIVLELAGKLTPSRLIKIHSHTKTSCQLVLKPFRGKKLFLFLDFTPKQTRLHLVAGKLSSMPAPPAWVMKLRKEIEGMTLSSIQQVNHDRVVKLDFKGTENRPHRAILATFFDKIGHLILLDENDRVVFSALGDYQPGSPIHLVENKTSRPPKTSRFPAPHPITLASNHAAAQLYTDLQYEGGFLADKRRVEKQIKKEQDQLSRKIQKMRNDLQQATEAAYLHRKAQAIKANLSTLRRGLKEIELADPYEPQAEPITVQLDPALSPIENMQKLFKRSRRLQAAKDQIQQRLEENEQRQSLLLAWQSRLQQITHPKELEIFSADMTGSRLPKKRPARSPGQPRLPYKSYQSEQGVEILVGRSAKDNHTLTFRVARGEDTWLHASEKPGAHVIVRLGSGLQLDDQTLLDAATLAAEASGGKAGDKREIIYTKVKYVHSIKGASPGLVSVAKTRTIMILIEPDRLKRLHA